MEATAGVLGAESMIDMRRHRIFGTATLLGAAAIGLIWIASAWWACTGSFARGVAFSVYSGRARVSIQFPRSSVSATRWWSGIGRHTTEFYWTFKIKTMSYPNGISETLIDVPLWMLIVPLILLRQMVCITRQAAGLCDECGYDLRGAPHAACPECGASIPPPEQATRHRI